LRNNANEHYSIAISSLLRRAQHDERLDCEFNITVLIKRAYA
jgi:hypothetical protein